MGCFWGKRDNNSYVSNSITYNYRVGSTPKAKNYRYGEAFKEKTTRSEGISCNSYANCYIGCSCASGWTQGTAPSSGEYVWATDNRYTGVNSLSVGSGLNASGTIDAQSASSGISASGLSADSGAGISAKSSGSGNYSVSTMGTSGGMTCYKKACPDGYYLDAPNSTAFKSTSTTGPVELTCYKATGCKDGYTSTGKGAKYSWHGMNCNRETTYYLCSTSYTETRTQSQQQQLQSQQQQLQSRQKRLSRSQLQRLLQLPVTLQKRQQKQPMNIREIAAMSIWMVSWIFQMRFS